MQLSAGGEVVSFLLAGGGEGLDLAAESSAFYDVASKLKGPYDDSAIDDGKFLGMQFYQGEPVQLWASAPDLETGTVSVYMYRRDGTRETCIERIDRLSGQRIEFRDSQGCCYSVVPGGQGSNDSIVKLDSTGKTLYTAKLEGDRGRVEMFCELSDGHLAILVNIQIGRSDCGIVLLDADGRLTAVDLSGQFPGKISYIGAAGEDLLFMVNEYMYRVALPSGQLKPLFSFALTTYSMRGSRDPVAFCVHENGQMELLRADLQGGAVCETLSLTRRDGSRQEITLRGLYIKNLTWLKEKALQFNNSNDRYQVVIEGPEEWDDESDYIARTGVELATGKGPDILVDATLMESPASLIEKGGLVDLAPLMKQSGMKEDDYFPIAFDMWRTGESIYSVRFFGDVRERLMSTAVLGDVDNPGIGDVVDALLAYPENAVYYGHFPAGSILRELLEGSETLWGMVDWEKGNCDFGGEWFRKLLEAAKRYGYDGRNNYPAICSERFIPNEYYLYIAPTLEAAKKEGYVPAGILFDDGIHPIRGSANASVSVNANSANVEGAWEFLQFLLSEEAQGNMLKEYETIPVKRSAFWASLEEEILNGPFRKNYGYNGGIIRDPLPREKAEEIEAFIENARALPYRTEAILGIILEEAQEYFDGVKEIPQVVDAIENRVGLYLEERK